MPMVPQAPLGHVERQVHVESRERRVLMGTLARVALQVREANMAKTALLVPKAPRETEVHRVARASKVSKARREHEAPQVPLGLGVSRARRVSMVRKELPDHRVSVVSMGRRANTASKAKGAQLVSVGRRAKLARGAQQDPKASRARRASRVRLVPREPQDHRARVVQLARLARKAQLVRGAQLAQVARKVQLVPLARQVPKAQQALPAQLEQTASRLLPLTPLWRSVWMLSRVWFHLCKGATPLMDALPAMKQMANTH